jgi:peptidoglycan/xylan/chitin deacetylase (PgdA/CDA1 family)
MRATRALKTAAVATLVAGAAFLAWWGEQPRRGRGGGRAARPSEAPWAPAPADKARAEEMVSAKVEAPPNAPSAPSAVPSAAPPAARLSNAKPSAAGRPRSAAQSSASVSARARATLRRANVDLSGGPLYFTGAFDGSQRFGMWAETLSFARSMKSLHGKKVSFTYFINTCYYDPSIVGSTIGQARSAEEVLVRRALTQQAINEGHEIASHTARHRDGSSFSEAEWREELAAFHAVAEASLFQPVRDEDGEPAFPRFRPVPGAARGATGASCSSGVDCASGRCIELAPGARVCSEACNQSDPCPRGTACGTPDFTSDTDLCVPVPEYPIELEGAVLFDAEGRPNRDHPALVPYRVVGFRAPYLGYNDALFSVLFELGYTYDASLAFDPGPPLKISLRGDDRSMFELGLMQHPGTRALPMDYNYFAAGADGERMEADYYKSLVLAFGPGRRSPWNVGHHFALWSGGAYFRALESAFVFAARGCPSERGALQCPSVEFPSFRDLAELLAAEERRRAGTSLQRAKDGPAVAIRARGSDEGDEGAAMSAEEGEDPH